MAQVTLDQYFRRIFALKQSAEYPEWFSAYCSPLTDPLRAARQYNFRKYLVQKAGIKPDGHARALDAGCGFGPNCLCFHMMGFRQIHGVDFHEPMIETMRSYLREIGLDREIIPHRADVAELSKIFPENTFDVALSNEALSHYHDVDAFLREAYKVIRPGGALIISDNNNGANPKIRRMNQEIWDRFEKGPPGKVFTHTLKEPYVEMRARIVREFDPALSKNEVDKIAAGTFLKKKDEVVAAARRYAESGELPGSFYKAGVCPLEPFKNEVMERWFEPYELAERMRKIGFKPKVIAYLGGATRRGLAFQANRLWELMTPVTLRYSNIFVIIAHK